MDARKGNIFEILNGNRQFLIPVYQRYYSWEQEQCERLWNDIVDMQRKCKNGHFVGSIVNIAEQAMPTGVQKYMIIDGQQRVTTLTLLLIALRDYAQNNPEDNTINSKRIDNMLLKNEYEAGDDRYKLLLTETDKNILISLVEKKPIQEGVISRLINNYNFFYKKILDMEISPAEIYESIGKLQIVNITLERNLDDAQAIFESLNSTGKELSESDLIRNYVLMGLDISEQSYVYEHYWRPMESMFLYETQDSIMDRFFRDYLTMKLARIPKQNRVYEEFKLYHLNCEFSNIKELCSDLLTFSKYYTDIVFVRSNNPVLKSLYEDLNNLRMEVSYPFILKLHYDFESGIIDENTLCEIIGLCVGYVFRRSICEIPTNSLNKTFATLKNEVRNNDYLNSIKAFFILRDDYKVYPNDDQFKSAFMSKDIYNMRTRNYILSSLENYNNKSSIIIENYTIEHIMPQKKDLSEEWKKELGSDWESIHKKYLHTIGNLTLTAYNSEMSYKPFVEKRDMEDGFKESALRLNSYVVLQDKWDEESIIERARLLSEKACNIWKYPILSEEEIQPYLSSEEDKPKYSIDTYDFNAFTRMLFDILDKRIMNLSPNVKKEYKKLYIAYKFETNFVDIVIQKSRLRLSLNMKYNQILDPKNICKDITGLGRWGNGDIELFFEHTNEIEDIMFLVEQSYNLQNM